MVLFLSLFAFCNISNSHLFLLVLCTYFITFKSDWLMSSWLFNATVNKISIISWQSLSADKTYDGKHDLLTNMW